MSLGVKLNSILEHFKTQISLVMDVTLSTYDILKYEFIQIRNQMNTEEYRKKYYEYLKTIEQLENSAVGTGIYLSEQHQEIFEKKTLIGKNIPKSEHLMNMTLVYLIALFEGFNKKLFYTLLLNKPEQMKNKKDSLNYEKLIEFDSIEKLHKYLAESITFKLGFKNIDEFNNYLVNQYNIKMDTDFTNWERLRDNYYRRNILVHNNGLINETCIDKLNLTPDLLNSKPIMDIEYLKDASNNLNSYLDFIFNHIITIFKLDTSVLRHAPFPPDFDKTMVVKKGKDEIFDNND
jgi:hypothetical protein